MNNYERDTHFQGFAKLLYDELGTLDTLAIQRGGDYTSFDVAAKKLIAQRAYDLAVHVLEHQLATDHYRWPALSAQEALQDGSIPDLTKWHPTLPKP